MSTRDELAASNAALSEAMANQDVDRVVGFYTEDARLLFPGTPIVRGRAAIAALFADELRDGPVTIRFESDDILEAGAFVVDVGHIVTPTGRSKYVVVYQREHDGTLRIAVDAASGDGPPKGN